MSSHSTVAASRHKLSRLTRTMDSQGTILSTPDPLLCEIMIANTVAQLAVAEAIQEQTQVLAEMRNRQLAMPYEPYSFSRERYQGKQLENWTVLLRILDNMTTHFKELIKVLRGKK